MTKINKLNVQDIRFPTSNDLTGSDAIHTDPDYSATYVTISTNDPKLKGYGIAFTIGKGNDIVAKCIEQYFYLFEGLELEELETNIGKLWFDCVDHSQLRWLGPEKGVVHMAIAAIFNAAWDLIAKKHNKPLWKLISDYNVEQVISLLTFKGIEDVLNKDEAYKILNENLKYRKQRISLLEEEGYQSYTTAAGWLGYSNEKIVELCNQYIAEGWRHFKIKVGNDLSADIERLKLIRNTVGKDCFIMVDANQQWSVDQAIKHINAYKEFDLLFVEEPISPDDIIGFQKIKKAVGHVNLATGEACSGRIMFKQFLEIGAMNICQIDSCRLGSINEIITVLLMAHKLNVPVFPHAGGVGLCEYVQHLCMIDFILINGEKKNKVVEYQDSLHEHFKYPCKIVNGSYMLPKDNGYSIEMLPQSVKTYEYPNGSYWKNEIKK